MDLMQETKQKMSKVLEVLQGDLATVRTGRATPALFENVVVSVYGGTTKMKVMEVATIGTLDPQTLVLTPFDQSIIGEIQKGITNANVGLTPVVDGQVIRISIPPLSQERREQLIHMMKQKLENGKVMVRQVRHDALTDLKKQTEGVSEDEIKRMEKEIQQLTDQTIEHIDTMGKKKEEDLLQM